MDNVGIVSYDWDFDDDGTAAPLCPRLAGG
jgi:hypothetical protein